MSKAGPLFHIVAQLQGGTSKLLTNLDRERALRHVVEFEREGTLTTRWGAATHTRQAHELVIYRTNVAYSKAHDGAFDAFRQKHRARNHFGRLKKDAEELLKPARPAARVFYVTPIQGHPTGTAEEQRVHQEYERRFVAVRDALEKLNCVAIRIDKVATIGGLVEQIKQEIRRAAFVVVDLTDERPSCYYEAGFAEALGKSVIYVASEQSVMAPASDTKIHFDIHSNIHFFRNTGELRAKLRDTVEQHRATLLPESPEDSDV